MSYENRDERTTTLERPTQPEVIDLIDRRVEENTFTQQRVSQIEMEMNRFDNSHKAQNLNQVYEAIDRQNYTNASSKPTSVENPFFGDNDALEKLHTKKTYNDVVVKPESPTIEIKAYEQKEHKKPKKSLSNRLKLWIGTSACCAVLLVGLIICNACAIGAIDRQAGYTENLLTQQEKELDGLNGSISSATGTVPSGMTSAGAGQSVNIAPTTNPEIVTSDNVFNKIAEFIAYLFGR